MSQPEPGELPGTRIVLRYVGVLSWSTLVWVALWGDLSAANVVWGVLLGTGTLLVVPVQRRHHKLPVRLLPLLRFAGVFLLALFRSSAVVAWEVVTPRNDINEGIVEIPLRTSSPGVMTVLGNAITLTPGTLTLEVRADPPALFVHVLHLRKIEDVRADIHRLEEIVLEAFADEAALRTPRPGADA